MIFVSINIESCENLAAIIEEGMLKMLFLSCRSNNLSFLLKETEVWSL